MEKVNGLDMIREYLIKNKYHGLYDDECGCTLEDLAPCNCENIIYCLAGVRCIIDGEECIGPRK